MCLPDPMPTPLTKSCLPVLCPLLTKINNTSLLSRSVPTCLKTAAVTPILKKPGTDQEDFNNYRPISNLPFLAKLLESIVVSQLQVHVRQQRMGRVSMWF